ncbi:F-box/FBD/LRR-repeat protein At1g13570-like [Zingiber officinale]|uniref:F-box/FBD/LRR-repeat protein At1g13570-like n=1 Tax=Zingiber officinale TaxID=94328 RepID=UPI001C4BFD1D|nr:F-box/FBD/LRR-repeat protein At1g13570-like [Zingiber officinale]
MSSIVIGNNTLDRISHLPPNIIEQILMRLPLRDAIRTSILSHDWRYAWSSIPHLAFSWQEFPLSICNYSQVNFDRKLVDIIHQVLLLHQGPIHRFELSIQLRNSKDIDGWLLFLSRNDIREIILHRWEGEVYKLPSCLLSCKGLRSLSLHRCMFRPVHFQGFPRLASLFLRSVAISQDGLEALITACPLLNKLCLIDMFDFGGLKVCSPSLVNLTFVGEHIDLAFENVPLLATLSVSLTVKSDKYYAAPGVICKLFRILYHLPSIKKIVLGGQAFKVWTYGELPIQLPCTYQLKHFHATVNFKDMQEMFAIVSLCRSCPLLVTLELEARFVMQANHETPVEKFWNSQQSFDCLFSQLKNLEITGVSSILELPFLKFVLANAPVLETAYIGFDYRLKTELDITREMIKFRRLSPAAEIKILKRKFRNASSMWA